MTNEATLRKAIELLLEYYRTESCPDESCCICQRSKAVEQFAKDALKGVNVIEKYVTIYGEQHRVKITEAVELVVRREYWQQKKWNWDYYFQDLINESQTRSSVPV
jgi:hypothetical protein